ncbi:TetR/AcrR family transcriptional regulator [Nocardia sp. NPDC057227]|uniref:TetR/AcrR family transcriptional regulator n=1 Tax=Nocardia sp. NPDC057227 TaxID=3346056 RepID=UPI003626CE94
MAPPSTLDRATIVDAAIRMLERDGIDGLSMRGLAAELGSKPMTLYHHVPSKSALLQLALTELAARIPWAEPTGAPRERMIAVVADMYDRLGEIRWVVPILGLGTHVGAPALVVADLFIAAAMELGLSGAEALALWRAVWWLVAAELLWQSNAARRPPGEQLWYERVDPAELAHLPAIARLLPEWSELSGGFDLRHAIADQIDGALARILG